MSFKLSREKPNKRLGATVILLGAHESVAGGLHLALSRICQVGGDVLQLFTRNQRQWAASPLTPAEITLFREAHRQSGNMMVFSHASYLVNIASGQADLLKKSISNLALELGRCAALGIPFVVLHPGAHGGDGVEEGLARCIDCLDLVLGQSPGKLRILLETTAGQGTGLGSRFEELAFILQNSQHPDLLGVCVDTCHIFAAGYDIRKPADYAATVASLEKTVGLEKVYLFHVNDSKTELGSRVDRHQHIGQGAIGLDGFANLLTDRRFAGVPMILETPKGESLDEDRVNLRTLRALL